MTSKKDLENQAAFIQMPKCENCHHYSPYSKTFGVTGYCLQGKHKTAALDKCRSWVRVNNLAGIKNHA